MINDSKELVLVRRTMIKITHNWMMNKLDLIKIGLIIIQYLKIYDNLYYFGYGY